MNIFLAVFVGGGLGSVFRFGIHKLSMQYIQTGFPIATFISNIISTSLLALIVWLYSEKATQDSMLYGLLVVGFCGGFSTFSTFSYETYLLIKSNNYLIAFLNIAISVVVSILLIFLILRNK